MQHEPHPQSPGSPAPTAESLDSAALSRRRALLKGLSKGGVAVAAVGASQTAGAVIRLTTKDNLVNVKTNTGMLCTVSGQQSAVMSRSTVVNTCKGYAPGYYVSGTGANATPQHWPSIMNPTGTRFKHLYDTGARPTDPVSRAEDLLLTILGNAVDSPEAYWIAAYFNTLRSDSDGLYFPYSNKLLKEQYASSDYLKYLQFYKAFLSSAA